MKTVNIARSSRSGMALAVAVLLVTMSVSAALLMTSLASSSNVSAEVRRQKVRAQYLAEGALNVVEGQLRDQYFDSSGDPLAVYFLGGTGAALESWFTDMGTVQLDAHGVDFTTTAVTATTEALGADGLLGAVVMFEIETQADLPGAHARGHRLLRARLVPIFQYGVFYDMDLPLWPGPDMTITGRVHTNGDLYLGSSNTLRFDTNSVRAAGDLIQSRHWKEATVGHGEVEFRRWVEDPWDPREPVEWVRLPRRRDLDREGIPSQSGLDSRFGGHDGNSDGDYADGGDLAPFAVEILDLMSEPASYAGGSGSTVQTGEHGVGKLTPPDVSTTSMYVAASGGDFTLDAFGDYVPTAPGTGDYAMGLYHRNADLTILVKDNGSWLARSGSSDVTTALAGVVTISSLADVREGYVVDTAEIDLEALQASGYFPGNGLLYLGAEGGIPLQETKGFVIKNGAELGASLTTVSQNALFVQGDFNTVNKKPAAVIADTVNLLSNDWNNSKTLSSSRSSKDASETTYNMAIVTGHTNSEPGVNRGEMNNMVRFHEDWRGVDCIIKGSFVAPWEPVYTGSPLLDRAYYAPNRLWSFDPSFLQPGGLPPFTPCYLELDRAVTW